MIYINIEEGWKSTAHPARFTDPDNAISDQLPEGWERRLDSWGNFFFVDRHTLSTTREDPRFNKGISQDTGLPTGWSTVKDYEGVDFFFRKRGKMILDTYDPTTMTRKDLYHKIFVAKEPEEGEQPRVLKKSQELLGKSLTDTMPSKPPEPAPTTARTSDAISSPTSAESRTSIPTEEK